MKVYRLELVGFDDDQKRKEMYALSQSCQQITNRIWQLWETHHVANDSRTKLVQHFDKDRAWRETKQGERPKWPVQCVSKELSNAIYHDLRKCFPGVHVRVITLLQNQTLKLAKSLKAANGNLPGWCAILLNMQARPTANHPAPIPFDVANSKILPGEPGKPAELFLRVQRVGDRKVVAPEKFLLRTTGPAAKYVKPIVRMASGEWEYKGSSLYYDWRKKKWFALVVCEVSPCEKVQPAPESYLIVRPGFEHPFQFRVNGRRFFMRGFGQGRAIAAVRRQLLTQRWARQDNYNVAGSSNKGHGRNRTLSPLFLLSKRWKDFVKRYNHNLTAEVIKVCMSRGIGRVVYIQPSAADGRFLAEAGKVPGREDSTGWDFFQVKSMLGYKCERHGIEFVGKKFGGKGGAVKGSVAGVG